MVELQPESESEGRRPVSQLEDTPGQSELPITGPSVSF